MPNRASSWIRRAARPAVVGVGVVLLIGIASTVASLWLGYEWTWRQFFYDVGLGAFTATAVSALLELYLQSHERREEARISQQATEWQRIEGEVADLREQYRQLELKRDLAALDKKVSELAVTVAGAQGDVLRRMKEVLTKVDPGYQDEFDIAFNRAWSEWVARNTTKPDSQHDGGA